MWLHVQAGILHHATHAHTCVHAHTHTHAHTHAHTHGHTHTCTHTHTHTHTHAHTHTHTLVSYAVCVMTSGAIQNGVPTKVLRLFMDSVSWPATPKSANLTSPNSDSRTLAAARHKRKRTLFKPSWFPSAKDDSPHSNKLLSAHHLGSAELIMIYNTYFHLAAVIGWPHYWIIGVEH